MMISALTFFYLISAVLGRNELAPVGNNVPVQVESSDLFLPRRLMTRHVQGGYEQQNPQLDGNTMGHYGRQQSQIYSSPYGQGQNSYGGMTMPETNVPPRYSNYGGSASMMITPVPNYFGGGGGFPDAHHNQHPMRPQHGGSGYQHHDHHQHEHDEHSHHHHHDKRSIDRDEDNNIVQLSIVNSHAMAKRHWPNFAPGIGYGEHDFYYGSFNPHSHRHYHHHGHDGHGLGHHHHHHNQYHRYYRSIDDGEQMSQHQVETVARPSRNLLLPGTPYDFMMVRTAYGDYPMMGAGFAVL